MQSCHLPSEGGTEQSFVARRRPTFMLRLKYLIAFAALAALVPNLSFAQAPCSAPSPDCVVVGEWDLSVAVGIGERSNPIVNSSDIPLVVIPQISYYGKRFFLENLELGYTLYEGAAHTLNLIATPGYDRVFFIRDDPQNYFVVGAGGTLVSPPTPDIERALERPRHTTYLVGPEWLFDVGRLTGQVSALYEATGRHKGYEVRTAVAVPLVQTRSSLVLSGGFTWKSSQLVDYYYGIDRFYEPSAALSPFIKLGFSRPLGERWSINAFVHYEYLDDAIAESPIVVEDSVTSAFVGVVFKVF
jgi:outer membrane protein